MKILIIGKGYLGTRCAETWDDAILSDKIVETVQDVEELITIQNKLFTVGAILATPPEKETLKNGKERLNIPKISEQDITRLETQMDIMNESLPEMTHFVLPGGHTTVSYCHIARCVCRRAERIATLLDEQQGIDPRVLKYLNRLSDYLFVVARKLSYDLKAEEVKWIPEKI